jgi:hypothetical protein
VEDSVEYVEWLFLCKPCPAADPAPDVFKLDVTVFFTLGRNDSDIEGPSPSTNLEGGGYGRVPPPT